MTEAAYQRQLIKRIYARFNGCTVLKNDEQYQQGIPDLTILWGDKWAMLEVKPSADASYQPNQEFFLQQFDAMSFAATIFPENEEEVLSALEQAFAPRRRARIPQPQ